MAIYGIGAYYDPDDVSGNFIANNVVGVGWEEEDAPELHEFIKSLKVGDLIYIKSFPPGSETITIKAIGVIIDRLIVDGRLSNNLVAIGRNVQWLDTDEFVIHKPVEKNNVRRNTLFEEYHPSVQIEILQRILPQFNRNSI